jgi:hypothetical protein
MNPRIPDTHAEAWNLLPWLANGRLPASEREWVEAHVHGCPECRAEFDAQRQLSVQMHAAGDAPAGESGDEQRSFDKLWARIEAAESAAPVSAAAPAASSRGSSRLVRWLAAAVVVQGFGLALFGILALRGADIEEAAGYRTVSAIEPSRADAPAVRLVFAPHATIGDINSLLEHQGLSIVSGPGLSGNFTAVLSADAVASGASAESVAAVISRDPKVTFAQPVAR